MKEKNRHRLREALDKLPEHDPPAAVWTRIVRAKLPTYAPPPEVWNAVSAGLDERKHQPQIRRLLELPRWALVGVAAAIALLLAATATLVDWRGGPEINYTYGREAMPASAVPDWDDEDASFASVRRQVSERNEPTLNNLGHELDELSSAREEVKSMLMAYGESSAVVKQLAEIERERDDVYRRIIIEL